ncbi:MAG: class I SAM-dependent methyltransferase [Deltaproteobacteria bacterium]|nr:class I SAM-dependent methyltransferase [Deltaproteobacteria bacterium]
MGLSPLQRLFQDPRVLALYERGRESLLFRPVTGRSLDEEVAEILAAVDDGAGPHVLDLGCGQGTFAVEVALARPTFHVTGLDISPSQLDRARRKAAVAGGGVSFVLADAARMPFPDASFGAAFSMTSLHQMPDQPAVARELARVCLPGALLFGACIARPRAAGPLTRRTQALAGVWPLESDRWGELLEQAGFRDYRYEQRSPVWGAFEARRA